MESKFENPLSRLTFSFLLLLAIFSMTGNAAAQSYELRWGMNEGSGQEVEDSANDYDATLGWNATNEDDGTGEVDEPEWTSDSAEGFYALNFDGEDPEDVVEAEDSLNWNSISGKAWIKINSTWDNETAFINKRNSFRVGVTNQGSFDHELVFSVYNSTICGSGASNWCNTPGDGYNGWIPSGYNITDGEWTEVGFTWNTTHAIFFVDGEMVNAVKPENIETNGSAIIEDSPEYLNLGSKCGSNSSSCNPNEGFNGKMDDVRLYPKAQDKNEMIDAATTDDYTKTSWQNTTQSIKIKCLETCWRIGWRILDEDGNTLRSDSKGPYPSSIEVDVGLFYTGILELQYRGYDSSWTPKEDWNSQIVKIDKTIPSTNIVGPDPDGSYYSNFTVNVDDSNLESNTEEMDLKYIVDTSSTFENSTYNELESAFPKIEDRFENDTEIDMQYSVLANNNSYHDDPDFADNETHPFYCKTGQPSPRTSMGKVSGPIECKHSWSFIDSVANTKNYIDWLNNNSGTSYTVWNFDPKDRVEPPSEGWGMSMLDVKNGNDWIDGASRVLVPITNQDSNGGDNAASCGDSISQDLTQDLRTWTKDYEIDVIGLVDDTECGGSNAPKNQLDELGESTDYSNKAQFESYVRERLNDSIKGKCEYQLREVGGTWSDWQSRSCPDGSFKVGANYSSDWDCTKSGENSCEVRVKAIDRAGNIATDYERYSFWLVEVDDDYNKTDWQTSSQMVEISCNRGSDKCDDVEWEIRYSENDSLIREGKKSDTYKVYVEVGKTTEGTLDLRYRGNGSSGETSGWKSQRVLIDKTGPATIIQGPDEDDFYVKNFTVSVEDKGENTGAQFGTLDLAIWADSSGSFGDEWNTLIDKKNKIIDELENETSLDVKPRLHAGKETSDNGKAGIDESKIYRRTNLTQFQNWDNYSGEPYSADEGWGIGVLDIYEYHPWSNDSFKRNILIGDTDSTGNDNSGHCDDDQGKELAKYIGKQNNKRDIVGYGVLAEDLECDSSAPKQMNIFANYTQYGNADELPDEIIARLEDERPDTCFYRVKDGSDSWSPWKNRTCPDGDVNISVGVPGSGDDCTTEGENTCKVEVRVEDGVGRKAFDFAEFNIGASCGPIGTYRQINELEELSGRVKNDKEYCANIPGGRSKYLDQDYSKEACRTEKPGIRWIENSTVKDKQYIFSGGIDDDWSRRHRTIYTDTSDPSSAEYNYKAPPADLSSGETPVPSGWRNDTIHTAGFCAGDDQGEYLIHQKCDSNNCDRNKSAFAVSNSPDKCVLSPEVRGYDSENRTIHKGGSLVELDIAATKTEIACFGGYWYSDWPLSFTSGSKKVELGGEKPINLQIINVAEDSKTYRLSKEGPISNYAEFLGDARNGKITVGPRSSQSVLINVDGVKLTSSAPLTIQAVSEDRQISGEDTISINIVESTGGSNNLRQNIPGITGVQLAFLLLASSVIWLNLQF